MKTRLILATLLALPFLSAEDGHDHHKEIGPNQGLVLTQTEPHMELFLQPDRFVRLTVLTEELKPAPVDGAAAKLTGGQRSAPTTLNFVKKDGFLLSNAPLPEGNPVPIILHLQAKADAEPVTVRLNLNLSKCPECSHPEYACICEHE